MSRSRAAALVLGLLGLGLIACEKDRPVSADPGPTVIVEQPGAPASDVVPSETAPATEPEFGTIEVVTTEVPCSVDADCVQDECCHATSCVAIADAPDCAGTLCTLECRANTMDCNGGCVCQAGVCAARLWSPPTI